MSIMSFKACCDKCKSILVPFYLWSKRFMVCPKCTDPCKKKPKKYVKLPSTLSKEERRAYARNRAKDKSAVEREIWGSKGKIYHKIEYQFKQRAEKSKFKMHDFEGTSYDRAILRQRKLK